VRRALVWSVAAVYALSWFLQVVKDGYTLADGALPGWQALLTALSPVLSDDPYTGGWLRGALSISTAVTNLVFLAAFVLLLRSRTPRTNGWTWILLAAALLDTFWLLDPEAPHGLRAGYYLWLASFVLLAIVARLSPCGPRAAA
jgi:hypothetical protein